MTRVDRRPKAFPHLLLLLALAAALPSAAQPAESARNGKIPRRWEVHAGHRYQTPGHLGNGQGELAWHDSVAGFRGGIFLPGLGLLRGGVDYAYTRFSSGSAFRLDDAVLETFGHVEEIRLSVQAFTPWSKTWSSQLFAVVSSAFESEAAPEDALSGAVALGMTRRFSARLSAGFGALLVHQMEGHSITILPIPLVDWRITQRLTLRSRQDVTLTYLLGAQQRLSVAAVASFFERRQFRLADSGALAGGAVELGGYTLGFRLTWRPAPVLALEGTVEAPLDQNLRVLDRRGRKVVDTAVEDGLQLSVTVRYRF